ncbi:MAG: hypothetical protein HZB68_05560 [Candidatus Aenigmarchaeota archaeon]|nr:hypothetical protein [Candidatus Aenigmarchaeota archaeon]
MKGSSYIDFAVGAGILILSLSLVVSYVNSILPERPSQSAEIVFSYFFGTEGQHPTLAGKIYKFSFSNEGGGAKRAEINLGERASLGSLIAYDGNKTIPIGVESYYDSDNDGLLEKAVIIVQPSASTKIIDVYYSRDSSSSLHSAFSTAPPGLVPLGEEAVNGIYKTRMASFNYNYDDLRNTTGISGNFRLSVNSPSVKWSYGPEPRGNVIVYSRMVPVQETDGEISFAKATAEAW